MGVNGPLGAASVSVDKVQAVEADRTVVKFGRLAQALMRSAVLCQQG